MKEIKLNKQIENNGMLLYSLEDTFKSSKKIVLSKWSAASFWGFSPLIDSKWNITVPTGYNNKRFKNDFIINQKNKEKISINVVTFIHEGVAYRINTPELALIEIIKDCNSFFSDVTIEAIKTFFKEVDYSSKELESLAAKNGLKEMIAFAMSVYG